MSKQRLMHRGAKNTQPYLYTGCGLEGIYLLNGFELYEDEDGSGVIIHDLDGLHRAIALRLVSDEKVLQGKEIRFLRRYMDLTQSVLGKLLACDSQTVARWEKDQFPISGVADRLLRVLVLEHMGEVPRIRQLVEKIDEMEDSDSRVSSLRFEIIENRWAT